MVGMAATGCTVNALSGLLRLSGGRRLRSPAGSGTRPTTARVREAVMNMLAPDLQGASWLDLCSGSGVMGCEAIERGVTRVWAVEKDPKTASICRQNLKMVSEGKSPSPTIQVIRGDVVGWLKGGRPQSLEKFDLIYFDPPYGSDLYQPTLDALLDGDWVAQEGLLICEHTKTRPLTPCPSWSVINQRHYGSSALLLLSLQERCHDDTDSKQLRTNPRG